MNAFQVAVLTPPGSAAIAVISVRGQGAWQAIRSRFRFTNGMTLPENPVASGIRFGRFGDQFADEVLLAIHNAGSFEIHCHGGRRVVDWLLQLLKSDGAIEEPGVDSANEPFVNRDAAAFLPFARTVRTAAILLDQADGAYDRAVTRGDDAILRRNASIGRHLVEPWRVAIAGVPNAGKSTLLNALAGYGRSIVSPIPGTTRDAVSVSLAFDGWPVDVVDTAGLRESPDALEQEGVQRALDAVQQSDLCLWVVDATSPRPQSVEEIAQQLGRRTDSIIVVLNKCDLVEIADDDFPNASRIAASMGQGIAELGARIAAALVPIPPQLGDPVPFTKERCDRWS